MTMPKEIEELDDGLADILWWLRGYMASREDKADPINSHHTECLRKVRVLLQERFAHE